MTRFSGVRRQILLKILEDMVTYHECDHTDDDPHLGVLPPRLVLQSERS